jgi:hypothetical protein
VVSPLGQEHGRTTFFQRGDEIIQNQIIPVLVRHESGVGLLILIRETLDWFDAYLGLIEPAAAAASNEGR